jgi:hypothetical protein
MSDEKNDTVFAVYRDRQSANNCFNTLTSRGYFHDSINVMMSDATRKKQYGDEPEHGHTAGNKATEGMGVGGVVGTAIGATIAAIAAIGTSIALPGFGLVIAGPIAAGIAGAGAGALAGGSLGLLVGLGLSEQDATVYNQALQNGGVVISVECDDSAEVSEVKKLMVETGGQEVYVA